MTAGRRYKVKRKGNWRLNPLETRTAPDAHVPAGQVVGVDLLQLEIKMVAFEGGHGCKLGILVVFRLLFQGVHGDILQRTGSYQVEDEVKTSVGKAFTTRFACFLLLRPVAVAA